MAAWALILLLAAPDLQAEVARSGVHTSGLSVVVGRAGDAPFFAIAPDTPRIPASNQKVMTAAAAVRRLGRDYRFETTFARGPHDELVVIGGGDPNLSGRFFDGDPNRVLRALAKDLAGKGIRSVNGLVLDASRFDDVYVHPDWPGNQLDRWYCAPVGALVFNDSCWDVTVYPADRAGQRARVEVQPALLRPDLDNTCDTTGARGEHVVHVGRDRDDRLEVRGKIRLTSAGITGNVTVRDPVRFFGSAFRAALIAEGIGVKGRTTVGRVPGATPLLVFRSDLARTLRVMLNNSQNLYAECVFKLLGKGSFTSAGAAMLETLADMGIPTEGVLPQDGSGLARTNRVTARALYGALQAMRDEPVFVDALAQGGTGTLRRRYKSLGDRVRAKTGTIRGVSALSGYVTGRDGGRYVFVILANGKSVGRARALQDRVVLALAREP
jgi:D-alanyl-D-alanine carboxypeptidase/D-alanyl-D-alanine-endopeptidase (penicillin-binding protein 4)